MTHHRTGAHRPRGSEPQAPEIDGAVASLFDLDPELFAGVPAQETALARRAAAMHVLDLAAGPVPALDDRPGGAGLVGLYVISGTLLSELAVGDRAIPELLGAGDIVDVPAPVESVLPVDCSLTALTPTRLLVLDGRFALAAARWPAVLSAAARRRAQQRQRLAMLAAIGQLPRVEIRLLALMWHLAASWGWVGPDGTVVPLTLTHEMLGRFVGARRPTVSLALGALAVEGVLQRARDGTWLLPAGSQERASATIGEGAGLPSVVARARVVPRA